MNTMKNYQKAYKDGYCDGYDDALHATGEKIPLLATLAVLFFMLALGFGLGLLVA